VKKGFLADLLLVDGDPLADLRILEDQDQLLAIMKDGTFHKAPVPRAMRADRADAVAGVESRSTMHAT
jgi:hypothetical protein